MNPQESVQQYYQSLMAKHDPSMVLQTDPHKELMDNFKKLNRSIQLKLDHFSHLTNLHSQKIETSFLVTFSKVLQKMGHDLMLAEQAYKNINKQIMEKQRCVSLNQDKLFFIQESTYYKQQFQFKSKQAEKLKEKSFLLIKQNTGLKEKLFEKVQEIMCLKDKCKKLQKTVNLQNQNIVNLSQSLSKPQKEHQATTKPNSPQKPSNNMTKSYRSDKNDRKWASLGRQTQEDKLRKEEAKNKQKNALLSDIRKELKTREKINLDSIINRSLIESTELEGVGPQQFRSRKKRVHLDLTQGSKTMRVKESVHNSVEMEGKKKQGESTAATQFEMTFNNALMAKRSLHTSGDRNGRNLKV